MNNRFNKSNQFINPIENSLLSDLVGLYQCDLEREKHSRPHVRCLACSKGAIVAAVNNYRALNSFYLSSAAIGSSPALEGCPVEEA